VAARDDGPRDGDAARLLEGRTTRAPLGQRGAAIGEDPRMTALMASIACAPPL